MSDVTLKGHLLIIDDDEVLCTRLAKAMEKRGYEVRTAFSVAEGIRLAQEFEPEFAVVDLRLADGNGLEVVDALRKIVEDCRIIMMTAYGNIATAVAAVKAGAIDYLAKPADADMIERALLQTEGDSPLPEPPSEPMPADRVKWEHILRVYEMCGRNVSETARRLRMHRRTLQRILAKHAPPRAGPGRRKRLISRSFSVKLDNPLHFSYYMHAYLKESSEWTRKIFMPPIWEQPRLAL